MGVEIPFEELPAIQKQHHHQVPHAGQARHHRHGDAGVHDPQHRAPPGRRSPTWPTPSTTAPAPSCSPARPPRANIPCWPWKPCRASPLDTEERHPLRQALPARAEFKIAEHRRRHLPRHLRHVHRHRRQGHRGLLPLRHDGAHGLPLPLPGGHSRRHHQRKDLAQAGPFLGRDARAVRAFRFHGRAFLSTPRARRVKVLWPAKRATRIVISGGLANGVSGNTNIIKAEVDLTVPFSRPHLTQFCNCAIVSLL